MEACGPHKRRNKMKYYTYPPINYPYVIRPMHKPPVADKEIVDIGIFQVAKTGLTEQLIYEWKNMSVWKKIVPDKLNDMYTTKQLFRHLYTGDASEIPVVQGSNVNEYYEYAKYLKEQVSEKCDMIAIGGIKIFSIDEIEAIVSETRIVFPKIKLHVLGLKLNMLYRVYHMIDSFDSNNWTFLMKKPYNKQSRINAFNEFLKILDTKKQQNEEYYKKRRTW